MTAPTSTSTSSATSSASSASVPTRVLVLNSGSSSLKYQLIDMRDGSRLAQGLVERIGEETSRLVHTPLGAEDGAGARRTVRSPTTRPP